MSGLLGFESAASRTPSSSSSSSPESHRPSASLSRPSLAVLPPLWSGPLTEQSSQLSWSSSWQASGLVGLESAASRTPSLSSSSSPALHTPSASLSLPSLLVLPPLWSGPLTEQSSQ